MCYILCIFKSIQLIIYRLQNKTYMSISKMKRQKPAAVSLNTGQDKGITELIIKGYFFFVKFSLLK